MIGVFLRIPAAAREAYGSDLEVSARMASTIPGVERSMAASVASGVTSRGQTCTARCQSDIEQVRIAPLARMLRVARTLIWATADILTRCESARWLNQRWARGLRGHH